MTDSEIYYEAACRISDKECLYSCPAIKGTIRPNGFICDPDKFRDKYAKYFKPVDEYTYFWMLDFECAYGSEKAREQRFMMLLFMSEIAKEEGYEVVYR